MDNAFAAPGLPGGLAGAAPALLLELDTAVLDPQALLEQQRERDDAIDMLGGTLQKLAEETVARRSTLEARWLDDLRQFNSQYDRETLARIDRVGGSQAFVNLTRPKVNTLIGRLCDILLPTDDTNYGVHATPRPELLLYADELQAMQVDPAQLTPEQAQELARSIADKRCRAMAEEMQDQLDQANYAGVLRDVIEQAAIYGTGILKGPVVEARQRVSWEPLSDGATTVHVGRPSTALQPTLRMVNLWDFFPDASALRIEDCDFIFERSFLTARQMRHLSRQPGVMADRVASILAGGAERMSVTTGHLGELRRIAGLSETTQNRYEVWEYHGALSVEDWRACGFDLPEGDAAELIDLDVIVTFVNGTVVKAIMNPHEAGERPYSVFVLERSDVSLFGIGIPRLMRGSQASANAAWRMLMDNGGLAAGVQAIVNKRVVKPEDGNWSVRPRKTWYVDTDELNADVRGAINFFDVPCNIGPLLELFNLSRLLTDEETSLPQIAAGQQGTATKTAQGMTILINAANTVLRRIVKNFDDEITKPLITRWYNWNMQYNQRADIKGDFQVIARGTAALMQRDEQIQRLMQAYQMASQVPEMVQSGKHLEMLGELFRLLGLEARFVLSDQQIAQLHQATQQQPPQQPPPPDPRIAAAQLAQQGQTERLQMQLQHDEAQQQLDAQLHMQKLALQRELAAQAAHGKLTELGVRQQLSLAQAQAQSDNIRLQIDAENQRQNAELAYAIHNGGQGI
ncbi:hypothetical protein SAMN02745857_02762 [Andreprevotia lacus DSM 23236]|jgi:hypothetical protein|uniref:Portal protein n=1 Tax=Andreprevotia lacus DSM 23236 TaxID=1121001 RepID=A0A1W1XTP3_9NEIS|nr:hypothetical protein [Andreprevotia lacus]SMC27234.1 hypothetical protein SAMN02745857_02762 [Andreprevotia lacus DSM 23236]